MPGSRRLPLALRRASLRRNHLETLDRIANDKKAIRLPAPFGSIARRNRANFGVIGIVPFVVFQPTNLGTLILLRNEIRHSCH
jgi:hypothetical protein